MGDPSEVKVRFIGDASSLDKTLTQVEGHTGKTGSIMTGIFAGVGLAAANLAVEGVGKVVDFLGDSSKVARDAEVTTARLTTALKNNVAGFQGDASAMEGSIDAGRKLGFTGDEMRASLSRLVTVTKSKEQATKDASIAEEVARARGIDLGSATDIVTKAQLGNVGALKRMGIAITPVTAAVDALKASHDKFTPAQLKAAQAADKQATATAALAAVHKAAAGQAEAYAGTMQGSLAVAGTTVEGIQEKLGQTLNQMVATVLPPLIKGLGVVGDVMGQLVQAAQPFVDQVVSLAGQYLGALSDAFGQIVEAVKPFIPIVQKLAGEYLSMLGAAFKVIVDVMTKHVIPTVTSIIKAVLPPLGAALKWIADDVVPSVSKAFQFVASHVMPLISSGIDWVTKNVLPALGAAFDWIVKNVVPPLTTAFQWIAANVLPALGTGFAFLTDKVIPALSNAFQGIAKVVGSVMGGIGGTIKTVINGVIGGVNALIRAIDSVKFHIDIPNPLGGNFSFGFDGVGLPTIPYLHSGGIVPGAPGSDVLAILQAGERVIPRGGGGGGPTVIQLVVDGRVLAEIVDRHLYYAGAGAPQSAFATG